MCQVLTKEVSGMSDIKETEQANVSETDEVKEVQQSTEQSEAEERKNGKEADEEAEESFSFTSFVFDWSNAFIIAFIAVVILLTFVYRQVTVSGSSMTDTLVDSDRLIISSFMYTPKDGDIVVISHGSSYDEPIIKRVIATGGQSLSINYDSGEVSVDGVILDEPYIKGVTRRIHHPMEIPETIPEGYVFVMGDNREGSLDSRSTDIGLIPLNNIIGKAEYRVFPFNKIGSVYS